MLHLPSWTIPLSQLHFQDGNNRFETTIAVPYPNEIMINSNHVASNLNLVTSAWKLDGNSQATKLNRMRWSNHIKSTCSISNYSFLLPLATTGPKDPKGSRIKPPGCPKTCFSSWWRCINQWPVGVWVSFGVLFCCWLNLSQIALKKKKKKKKLSTHVYTHDFR